MTITAKYTSRCPLCSNSITPGDQVEWQRGEKARHTKCPAVAAPAPRTARPVAHVDATPAPIHLSGGSGYGCMGWTVGQVILSSEKRRRAGGPDGLVVVRAKRQRVREDGLSFGVGEDEGYLYSADCRAATREELQPAIDEAQGVALAIERAAELKRVQGLFEAAPGERMPEESAPVGEQLVIVAGVNGGREWLVIEGADATERHIWRLNGGYYDDYRQSAWRLPWSAEIEARCRALAVRS